ncbi:MAG: hypothetical protein J0H31_27900 [Alphaproteobacteria bacterium]|nr:hypothetical protein [Alphaproteobacteria bacterium]
MPNYIHQLSEWPAFTWKPSENTSLTLLANYFDMKRGGSEQSLPISGTMYPNPVGGYLPRQFFLGEPGWNEERIKNTSVAYIFDHAFNESLRVQSTTRFISTESDYKTTGATNSGVLVNNRFYRRNAAASIPRRRAIDDLTCSRSRISP